MTSSVSPKSPLFPDLEMDFALLPPIGQDLTLPELTEEERESLEAFLKETVFEDPFAVVNLQHLLEKTEQVANEGPMGLEKETTIKKTNSVGEKSLIPGFLKERDPSPLLDESPFDSQNVSPLPKEEDKKILKTESSVKTLKNKPSQQSFKKKYERGSYQIWSEKDLQKITDIFWKFQVHLASNQTETFLEIKQYCQKNKGKAPNRKWECIKSKLCHLKNKWMKGTLTKPPAEGVSKDLFLKRACAQKEISYKEKPEKFFNVRKASPIKSEWTEEEKNKIQKLFEQFDFGDASKRNLKKLEEYYEKNPISNRSYKAVLARLYRLVEHQKSEF